MDYNNGLMMTTEDWKRVKKDLKCDDITAAILVASSVLRNSIFINGSNPAWDRLGHELTMSIRYGLYGTGCRDDTSLGSQMPDSMEVSIPGTVDVNTDGV